MKQYTHKIAKSKLEKLHLSEKQIKKVYSYKSKAKQVKVASKIAAGVKVARSNKFLKYGFAEHVLLKKQQKLAKIRSSDEWEKLSKKQQAKLEKQFWTTENKIIRAKLYKSKSAQAKRDLKEALLYRRENAWARLNAGEKAFYINKTRAQSYEDNKTINQTKDEFLIAHYPTEYQQRLDAGVEHDTIIEELWDLAIKSGLIEPLAQGVGYGYIDDTYKEVISPV